MMRVAAMPAVAPVMMPRRTDGCFARILTSLQNQESLMRVLGRMCNCWVRLSVEWFGGKQHGEICALCVVEGEAGEREGCRGAFETGFGDGEEGRRDGVVVRSA